MTEAEATAARVVHGVLCQAALEVCGRVAVLLGVLEGRTLHAGEVVEATGIDYPRATYALLVMRMAGLVRSTATENNSRVGFRLAPKGLDLLDAVRDATGAH